MFKKFFRTQPLFFGLVLLAGFAVYFTGAWKNLGSQPFQRVAPAEESARPVQAETLVPGDYEITRTLFGKIVARNRPKLSFSMNGCIDTVRDHMVVGGTVRKGEVLASLRTEMLATELKGQTARLSESRAQLEELKAKLEGLEKIEAATGRTAALASKSLERIETLRGSGSVSNAQLEKAQEADNDAKIAHLNTVNEMTAARAAIETQQSRVALSESAVETAQLSLKQAQLVSPVDGIIETANLGRGDCVTAFQPVIALIDPASLQAEFDMPTFLYEQLGVQGQVVGTRAKAALAMSDDHRQAFEVEVTQVFPAIDEKRRMLRLSAKLHLKNDAAPLIAGSEIAIRFPVQKLHGVFKLPQKALVGGDTLFLVEDGRLKSTPVTVEAVYNGEVYLRSDIAADLPVLTAPLRAGVDGMKVTIVDRETGRP